MKGKGVAMLRITVHETEGILTFQVEGRLAGPDVQVLEECWCNALARHRDSTFRLNLTDLTSVDAEGRACLAALHRQGAELVAADCLTKAMVAEITQAPGADYGHDE
jgi:hypothetical protein